MPGVELKASVRDVALRGDLDITGAADAEAATAALVVPGQTLIIDISALDFIDCAPLRALLRAQTLAGAGAAMSSWPRHSRSRGRICFGCWPGPAEMRCSAFRPAWRPPSRVPPAEGRGTLGGGLRGVLHVLGGQPHRIRLPG
jgi:hypothetical protein